MDNCAVVVVTKVISTRVDEINRLRTQGTGQRYRLGLRAIPLRQFPSSAGSCILMNDTLIKTVCGLLLSVTTGLVAQNTLAAGFYLAEVGSPASLGTGGVANPTNTFGADAAWTNPAGMTGLNRDQIFSGFQAVIPKVEFDSSKATAGGSDGGNAGNTALHSELFLCQQAQ